MHLHVLAFALAIALASPVAHGAASTGTHARAIPEIQRDAHGRIARDPRQLNAFKKQSPCPATGKTYGPCSGYVIDHVVPLKRGGADAPINMQWQTKAAAKEKDRWE